ncbi:MAG: histidinol dehydrogenase [Spirochaetaceae bacterium]|jgi:histidinol dehydrogenase|nr:histidinol dehydrogenase [Spirochaetaceae bacterium]
MTVISGGEFDAYWKQRRTAREDSAVSQAVSGVIAAVRREGDAAVRRFAAEFDKSSPERLEVPLALAEAGYRRLLETDPVLVAALESAAERVRRFAEQQKAQCRDFECETAPGLIAGQRVIPVRRAGVYVPAGRFPLISSVLMGVIPALVAGVAEVCLVSPPLEDGLPDPRILGAARLAGVSRIFAVGGAQAVAALAFGTETIPQADVIVGPGNKYVAAAKRLLAGVAGIDFVAGPTDVLIISDGDPDLIAADMLAQAEHDPEARSRAIVPDKALADQTLRRLEARLAGLPTAAVAEASLAAGGLIVISADPEASAGIANTIAPEHLELHVQDTAFWIPRLYNYGSLFIGSASAEVLGDYTAGINHTLPTSGCARFTGGLSVRHFLKFLTTLRCSPDTGWTEALRGAERIASAEGLAAHRESASRRLSGFDKTDIPILK